MQNRKMKTIWSKIRSKIGVFIQQCLISISVVIAAATFSGDWLVMLTNTKSRHGQTTVSIQDSRNSNSDDITVAGYFREFRQFWIVAEAGGTISLFLLYAQWLYFVKQKDDPLKWKCQPNRWLPRELEIDEIKTGSLALLVVNTWSAAFAYYLNWGGYTAFYSSWDEYGITWWFLQFAVLFLFTEYVTYWYHRFFHHPYFFKQFHYVHHKYEQPTAFSTTAFHPAELTVFQMVYLIPTFVVPLHWGWYVLDHSYIMSMTGSMSFLYNFIYFIAVPYHVIILNAYYHGILSHSGINFKSKWWQPWQPNSVFHDNHHHYCHVNYGANCDWFDRLHGTYRKVDRIYNSTIFPGKGKSIYELTESELKEEMAKRQMESKTGYDNDYNPYIEELEKIMLASSPP